MADLSGVALGGFLGLLGGILSQWLQGRRERERWGENNYKEEFRELMKVLTIAANLLAQRHAHSEGESPENKTICDNAYNESIRVLLDRIYTAKVIMDMDLYGKWIESVTELRRTNDVDNFNDRFAKIRKEIVRLVIDGTYQTVYKDDAFAESVPMEQRPFRPSAR